MYFKLFRYLLVLVLCFTKVYAQRVVVSGVVKDRQSDEPIPFASIVLQFNKSGTLTDSAGRFVLELPSKRSDTIAITSVGYIPVLFVFNAASDSFNISISMEVAPVGKEAVVKVKFNRALWFWNKIQKHKHKHDRNRFSSFSYEIYNKLELDLNNVKRDKLSKVKLIKDFQFVLDNIDSSEEKPFLPLFITESISDYYFQRNPKKMREVIKASKTNGIENESVTKLLGGMYQVVNVYNNYILIFDKQFISPLHDNADNYYNFRLQDTQYLGNKRLVHLTFYPKRKGENTFEGDCWVHDSTYAIQKVTLRPSLDANVNFVEKLTLIQEYRLLNDTTWFLSKDRFVVDISPMGKSRTGFKGKKTTTYRDVVLDGDEVAVAISNNKKQEEVVVLPGAEEQVAVFWDSSRHEELSKNEAAIYKMIDTIQSLPRFKRYSNAIQFIGTGYKNIGNYRIGPWYNWVTGNGWEGTRVRFDLGTNSKFDKHFYLHGYLAYGFGDKQWKGKADVFFLPKKDPRLYLYAAYTNDLDNGQTYYDEISTDNIFALAVRKSNVPIKFQKVEEKRLEFFKEWFSGFSILTTVTQKRFTPLRNLPDKSFFDTFEPGDPLLNFETGIRLRYAYLEKFLENDFFRSSFGSDYPIVEFRYNKGWRNVLQSSYDYHKISGSISDYMKVPPLGSLYYNFFGGRVFGTLPFNMLEIHPGNEMYYYNKYAFNMMNRFEYISDRYAGFNVEHNFGNGIFRLLPITRKLKFRQFWSAKGVWGRLSEENRQLNFVGTHAFKSLNDKMYIEVGTGVDNILKVLRVDFIWQVAPSRPLKDVSDRFGIFGSFRLAF